MGEVNLRFVHTGDLHIGKKVNELSMLEEQKHVLDQILNIAVENNAECILIAGDVYDKSVPGAEAVELFDDFLTRVSKSGISCVVISGNHDCAERIAFGAEIMSGRGIYMSKVYNGTVNKVEFEDKFGKINVYMLPFLRPANVRRFFENDEIAAGNYNEALACVLNSTEVDTSARNIILAHQFVTAGTQLPETCASEVFSVGGADNVDVSVFDKFDYAALGHIHRCQRIGRDTARYSGSPLKYSFSEVNHKKSVTIIDMQDKGKIEQWQVSLVPLHEMRELKGSIDDILSEDYIAEHEVDVHDYMHITLTDKFVTDAIGRVSAVYPNVMQLDFEDSCAANDIAAIVGGESKNELDIFSEFYKIQNDAELDESQKEIITDIINQCKGEY